MWKRDPVIAIDCSDLHLQLKPPPARAGEPDWFEAMARPLREIREGALELDVPVLCNGDIFDKWNAEAELISFAMRELPDNMYCIPGQHDLPYHNYVDIKRSAYWTLVESGKIRHCGKQISVEWNNEDHLLRIHPFPWGFEVVPFKKPDTAVVDVAMIHSYIWRIGSGYNGAPREAIVSKWDKRLRGYDTAVFGDNHKGFNVGGRVFNCGSMMRRHTDQFDYKPQIGLIHRSGKVTSHFLDTSKDVFEDCAETRQAEQLGDDTTIKAFCRELGNLKDQAISFGEAVEKFLRDYVGHPEVRELVLRAVEGKK